MKKKQFTFARIFGVNKEAEEKSTRDCRHRERVMWAVVYESNGKVTLGQV